MCQNRELWHGHGLAEDGDDSTTNTDVVQGTDCNDNNALVRPGIDEACNDMDDDCDGGIDDEDPDANQSATNFYKNFAFGVAFNVNDDLSISYGGWEAKKAGHTDSGFNPVSEDKRTIKVRSLQAAYTMGGASFRIADTDADNVSWSAGDNQGATTISVGLAF